MLLERARPDGPVNIRKNTKDCNQYARNAIRLIYTATGKHIRDIKPAVCRTWHSETARDLNTAAIFNPAKTKINSQHAGVFVLRV